MRFVETFADCFSMLLSFCCGDHKWKGWKI